MGRSDEEVFAFVNDFMRSVGTHLYGRRMYEAMLVWETAHAVSGQPDLVGEISPSSGGRPTTSSSLVREPQQRAGEPESSATSVPTRYGCSRIPPTPTSR
jgi:hypothetical protein